MLKAVIFDFDGVLCESVAIKMEAFRKLFADYPQQLKQIIQFHLRNGGMSRFEKFKIIYRDFLKERLTQEKTKELAEKFTQYSYQAVLDAPLVKGTQEFLEDHYQQLLLFIVSGTPQFEIAAIVRAKKLAKYFKKVFGSPPDKKRLTSAVLAEYDLKAQEAIFVGDSMNDYEGASFVGVKFIGRIRPGWENPFADVAVEGCIEDMEDLKDLLAQKYVVAPVK